MTGTSHAIIIAVQHCRSQLMRCMSIDDGLSIHVSCISIAKYCVFALVTTDVEYFQSLTMVTLTVCKANYAPHGSL
jgi:hypothetical protein